jgi:hypothetical protein
MPIGSYFLVIGATLTGALLAVNWYLEPNPPKRAQPAAQSAQASPISATAPVTTAATTAQAPSPSPIPEQTPPAATNPSEPTKAADTTDTKQSHLASKHKKRKQVAQRRRSRDFDATGEANRGRYAAYGYPFQSGYSQPFQGFRGW